MSKIRNSKRLIAVIIVALVIGFGAYRLYALGNKVDTLKNEVNEKQELIEKKEESLKKLEQGFEEEVEKLNKTVEEKEEEKKQETLKKQEVLKEVEKVNEQNKKLNNEVDKLKKDLLAKKEKKKQESVQLASSNTSKTTVSRGVSSSGTSLGQFRMSHYSPYCVGCTGISASGINIRDGLYYNGFRKVAVDRNKIPLGSIIEINSNGTVFKAIAVDTGGAIKGNRLDLLVPSEKSAYQLGIKYVDVKILRRGW